ncbi:hypothetical protein GCM10010915_00760 [Microbacterium faecale]|uniref:SnoaL-like domain-containing protein n=1 Tax=Microbacterium faecale TaxID=1804630 RepID=A0A916Y115_9MICO|nr:nuclear transport factor 2 family protein [Microbacterium faecale]GGD24681.1 hypothetical protein GCM10010915_00760 [Microbacterium faecale]
MAFEYAAAEQVSAAMRFELRETIAHWNRCLDAQDIPGMQELSASGLRIVYEGVSYEGADAAARFAAVHGSTDEVHRRTHVNHLQAWPDGERVRSRSFAMVAQVVPTTSPFGAGTPSVGWVGYTDDVFVFEEGRAVLASREFIRWGGDVLSGFPNVQEVAA